MLPADVWREMLDFLPWRELPKLCKQSGNRRVCGVGHALFTESAQKYVSSSEPS